MSSQPRRLAPDVSRILYVKSLPFKITASDLYTVFGKYGAIRQVRLGNTQDTRGKAFIVYEDIYDAKQAADHLNGYQIGGRYIVVLYWQPLNSGTPQQEYRNEMARQREQQKLEQSAPKQKLAVG